MVFKFCADVGSVTTSDPLAYDDLIRQHQTTAEREAEGKQRGWAGTLEASLLRSEARLAKTDPSNPKYQEPTHSANSSLGADKHARRRGPIIDWTIDNSDSENTPDDGEQVAEDERQDSHVKSAENMNASLRLRRTGQAKWRFLITQHFIDGCYDDFDYTAVDFDLSIDEEWARERFEEDWYEEQDDHLDGREGETGVQDF